MVSKKPIGNLPKRALTNIDLIKYVKKLKIPNFRGVYMRNNLPNHIWKSETGIINTDDKQNEATHWTAYIKRNKDILYLDSMGNLKPPREVIKYFKSDNSRNIIRYNHDRFQEYNTIKCGHMCLKFLYCYTR